MSDPETVTFLEACDAGDVERLRDLLDLDPTLVSRRGPGGATGLHRALRHPEAVRLLLERGADPNAREEGDNALPLHFAASGAPLETVRALLDGGSDVRGEGDAHRLEAIGWATVFAEARRDVADLLIARGARHHVFSAVALGDEALLRQVVADDPQALLRRLAPSEQEQTALHYVVAPPDGLVGGTFRTGGHYRTLEVLLELGADPEAADARGRTPLAVAMLRGDTEAMRRLHGAGARLPVPSADSSSLAALAPSIGKPTPMIAVADVAATLAWYRSIGFQVQGTHEGGGGIDWASVRMGEAELMFVPSGEPWREGTVGLSLWMRTDRLDELYERLKHAQLERAAAQLSGESNALPEVRFTADLYTAFYGQREFAVKDPNGIELCFFQPLE